MTFDFNNQTAIVTGAASGIGRSVSALISTNGGTVVGLDLQAEPNDEETRFNDAVDEGSLVIGDISDKSAVIQAVRKARNIGGSIDIAVNCAGIGSSGRLDQIDREDFDRAYNVHVGGTYNVCSEVIPEMVKHNEGRIINTSSIAASLGWPATADYAPAKGAIEGFTRQLAADYSPEGVRINAVSPGFVKTGMTSEAWEADDDRESDDRIGIQTARDRTLLPYLGAPEDVANVIAFLASDKSRFITGEIITIDGGWTISAK